VDEMEGGIVVPCWEGEMRDTVLLVSRSGLSMSAS